MPSRFTKTHSLRAVVSIAATALFAATCSHQTSGALGAHHANSCVVERDGYRMYAELKTTEALLKRQAELLKENNIRDTTANRILAGLKTQMQREYMVTLTVEFRNTQTNTASGTAENTIENQGGKEEYTTNLHDMMFPGPDQIYLVDEKGNRARTSVNHFERNFGLMSTNTVSYVFPRFHADGTRTLVGRKISLIVEGLGPLQGREVFTFANRS